MNSLQTLATKKNIAQSFSKAAKSYDKYSFVQNTIFNNLKQRIIGINANPNNILDLGSGTGKLTQQISTIYPHTNIIGLDLAFNMNKVAKNQYQHHFLCADAEVLPFKDETFDLIISNCTLQWCQNLLMLFKECNRALKPNGKLFFSTFGPNTLYELRQAFSAIDDKEHVHHFLDMHHIGDALLKSGLKQPIIDREDLIFTYKNVQQLLLDLKKTGAQNRAQTRRRSLTSPNIFKKMLQNYEHFKNQNRYPATYEIIYGHAAKRY